MIFITAPLNLDTGPAYLSLRVTRVLHMHEQNLLFFYRMPTVHIMGVHDQILFFRHRLHVLCDNYDFIAH